jgi:hypothetical protein
MSLNEGTASPSLAAALIAARASTALVMSISIVR